MRRYEPGEELLAVFLEPSEDEDEQQQTSMASAEGKHTGSATVHSTTSTVADETVDRTTSQSSMFGICLDTNFILRQMLKL